MMQHPHPLPPLHPSIQAALAVMSEPNVWERSRLYHQVDPDAQEWARWIANAQAYGQALLASYQQKRGSGK
jgi:hypothetical protein